MRERLVDFKDGRDAMVGNYGWMWVLGGLLLRDEEGLTVSKGRELVGSDDTICVGGELLHIALADDEESV